MLYSAGQSAATDKKHIIAAKHAILAMRINYHIEKWK